MKKIITLFAILALFAGISFAEGNVSKEKIKLAEKGYNFALSSDNAGVRNSALYQIAVLKARVPEINANGYKKMLDKVINNESEKPYIRVNAKMTLVILNNELPAEKLDNAEKDQDPNVFFNNIYEQLTDLYAAR